MASNKKITMTAYNGTDWDKIYPDTLASAGSAGTLVASDGDGGVQLAGSAGGSKQPIYIDGGVAKVCSWDATTNSNTNALIANGNSGITTREILDKSTTSPDTVANTLGAGNNNNKLITANTLYNSLPKFNGGKTYSGNTDFYVPTAPGTSGQILASTGGKPEFTNSIPKLVINTQHSSTKTTGGLWGTDGSKDCLLIGQGGSNLWIGANETNGTHHKGSTYISAGDGEYLYASAMINSTRTNKSLAYTDHSHSVLTFNNGGSGGGTGSTYNGKSALTVSYNTVGAAASGHKHSNNSDIGGPYFQTSSSRNIGSLTTPVFYTGNYADFWPCSLTASSVGLGNVKNERQYSAQNKPTITISGDDYGVVTTANIPNGYKNNYSMYTVTSDNATSTGWKDVSLRISSTAGTNLIRGVFVLSPNSSTTNTSGGARALVFLTNSTAVGSATIITGLAYVFAALSTGTNYYLIPVITMSPFMNTHTAAVT